MNYQIDQVKLRPSERRTMVEFSIEGQSFCTWLHDGVVGEAGQTAEQFVRDRLQHLGHDWRLFAFSKPEPANLVAIIGRESMERQGMRWPDPDAGSAYLVTQETTP